MPAADGFVHSTAGGRFAATFIIDELMYSFSGTFTSSVPAFSSNTAIITYGSTKELNSTRYYEGRVGPSKVILNVANGPVITGILDMPIFPGNSVSGSGVWTQS